MKIKKFQFLIGFSTTQEFDEYVSSIKPGDFVSIPYRVQYNTFEKDLELLGYSQTFQFLIGFSTTIKNIWE